MQEGGFRQWRLAVAELGGAIMTLELDPQDETHRNILGHLSQGLYYEHELSRLLFRVLRPGDLFVDVGANAGFFTMLGRMLVGEAGRVVAFEANPDNAALLGRNIGHNGFRNVEVVAKAATDAPGTIEFGVVAVNPVTGKRDSNGGLWGRSDGLAPSGRRIAVAACRLDQELAALCPGAAPKVLKIDTEGAEYRVLRGAEALVARRTVPFVVAELNIPGLRGFGSSPEQLRAHMRSFGYETFLLRSDGGLPILVPPGVEIQPVTVCNVLFAPLEAIAPYWPAVPYEPALDEFLRLKDSKPV